MLLGKRLELLHELVPKASIIGILVNPDAADAEPEIGEVTAAAQTLGQRIQVLSASGDAAIETAFATLATYMAKRRRPLSQGWKTLLDNHADGIAAMDDPASH